MQTPIPRVGRERSSISRYQAPPESLGRVSDNTLADLDQIDLLGLLTHQCVTLLGVDASGAMLANDTGILRVAAACGGTSSLRRLFESQAESGPCMDSYAFQLPVVETDLAAHPSRWPTFTAHALQAGIHAAHVLPLRVRGTTFGALGMFTTHTTALTDRDAELAQALADTAAIALLNDRAAQKSATVAAQLQTALTSRIVIEQAKGMLAERGGVSVNRAFDGLRSYARTNRLKLTDVCTAVVHGTPIGTRVLERLSPTA